MRILLDLQGCQSLGSRRRGIGRYSLSLAQAMLRASRGHEFHLLLNDAWPETVDDLRAQFRELVPADRICVFQPCSGSAEIAGTDRWRAQASQAIRRFAIHRLRPDVLHVSSLFEGLGDDSVAHVDPALDRVPTAVTLYDLIPLVHRERYLRDERTRGWYERKLESLRRADLLLGISASACEEARTLLRLAPERIVEIASAADPQVFHPGSPGDVVQRLGLRPGFVMYTGSPDWRKNFAGLVRAYARLPRETRAAHQLVLVCHAEPYARTQVGALLRQAGLDAHDVVLTGHVSDEDLARLYRACSLFVFPSLHEGFGLPVLEAMMCGAPAIGSESSSIPEVIGRPDALFDPRSDEAIAALMLRGLEDGPFRESLKQHAATQAARFSWENTAGVALDALERLHSRHATAVPASAAPARSRPRLAMVAPLPPARSGVAAYAMELLPVLRAHYDIELVAEQSSVELPPALKDLPVRTTAWFRAHAGEFDRIVYHFGNSMFHAHMFDLLRERPGVVVLHDFFLSGVMRWRDEIGAEPGAFDEALFGSHGGQALLDAHAIGRDAAAARYPLNRAVLQGASGVIVHSRFSMEAAERWYGPGCAREWRRIPHLRRLPPQADRAKARAALGVGPDDVLVCSFGHLLPTKLNVRAIEAWKASPLSADPRCRFVFVGGAKAPYDEQVRRAIEGAPRIEVTGYADRELYERCLCAADFAVQLRTQSRGETSGAILDCLAHGVPVIANANGSNAEYPGDVVRLLPDEFTGSDLVAALQELRGDARLRERRSKAGREWIRNEHDPATIAGLYRDAIEWFAHHPQHAEYREAVRAIAALRKSPAEDDLAAAAVALAATIAPRSDTARGMPAPSGAR